MRRHRERLVHEEMVGGFIAAATVNGAFHRPEKSVSALDFMPNHAGHTEYTQNSLVSAEELRIESDINLAALRMRLRWKAEKEPDDK